MKRYVLNSSIEILSWHTISHLNNSINEIKREIKSYQAMLPLVKNPPEFKRSKRGRVNSVGSGIKFLFGNPNAVDV